MIPDWMREVDAGPLQFPETAQGKKGFVGKTIDGILGFMEEAFVSEARLPPARRSAKPGPKGEADLHSGHRIRNQP